MSLYSGEQSPTTYSRNVDEVGGSTVNESYCSFDSLVMLVLHAVVLTSCQCFFHIACISSLKVTIR